MSSHSNSKYRVVRYGDRDDYRNMDIPLKLELVYDPYGRRWVPSSFCGGALRKYGTYVF